jgi:hypothetical protein
MYSYRFWTVSNGILYYSSWRTCSSCFGDVGGGNLFLTLVSKTDQSGSAMFKCHDCSGQGRRWSSPSCSSIMTEQFQLCEWEHCHLGKVHHCSEMSGSWDACDYLPVHILPCVIRPRRIIMGPTEYCTMLLLPKPSQNPPCVSLLQPGIPDCRLPWVFSKRKLFLM